jgi:hypothetical protein
LNFNFRDPAASGSPARASDLRREERIAACLPLYFENGLKATTRNVSASGIYFETDSMPTLGLPLRFSVEFADEPGGPVRVSCDANILRVEETTPGRWGVAAGIQWQAH